MNLCLSLLLVLGSFLSSSAQSGEECRPLITPLPTFEPSYGNWTFIMGYIDSKPFKDLFHSAQSQWIHFRKTSADNRELVEDIGIRHPTYCKFASSPVSIVRDSAVTDKTNFTCTYKSLPPSCPNCLVYMVYSRNNDVLRSMNVTIPKTIREVKFYSALYLMAKENVLGNADLEHFKKQARCMGFTGEPDFHYDPKFTMCSKSEE